MGVPLGFKIQKTLLSRPPAKGAFTVALLSVAFFALVQWVYVQGFSLGSWGDISDLLTATPNQVFGQHQYWRAWTTVAVHADLDHLFSNMLFFSGLAFLLSGYFGKFAFPILSFFFGGVINLLSLMTYPGGDTLVGASGVVYFMAAFWLALYIGIQRTQSLTTRLGSMGVFTLVLFRRRLSHGTATELTRLHSLPGSSWAPFSLG
jgi:rhomboid protease GluP